MSTSYDEPTVLSRNLWQECSYYMDGFLRRMSALLVENWITLASTVLSTLLVTIQFHYYNPDPHLERAMDSTVLITTSSGSGSGFFVTPDGCALTAAHVIQDAMVRKQKILVRTRGSFREFEATVVGLNQYYDTAMICIDRMSPAYLRVSNTEDIRQGDAVYAIGHPAGGRTWNVTNGVVSRMGYKMHNVGGPVWYPRYDIWTSAFISWGNSGGPLIDKHGDVIGMIVEWDGREIDHPNNSNVAVPGTDLRRFIRTLWGKY